ncbi:MAG: orotidine-5'-phosphate decarboxylase [Kouleothrix sp.]|jgi:orotidine-5'-phosphate decarboxylase|nr:orotidine-5'-phosphate decarboxylase [Kouleothrix sp.]
MTFMDRLHHAAAQNHSLLCVGLDPDPQRMPAGLGAEPTYAFCMAIVEATADLACAFKPNMAFFEALGPSGPATLQRLIAGMPRTVPVLVDAKRGDIGSTAAAYAQAIFGWLGADAVTLSPYLGGDALAPFLGYADKGCFVLCKTSNPGSADLQDLELASGEPLYMAVARKAQHEWNANRNVGLVVGATYPQVLARVRAAAPDLPLLVPGVGAQGGELAAAVRAALDRQGGGMLINASRSIMYAGSGPDFAEAARAEALRLRDAINAAIEPAPGSQQ